MGLGCREIQRDGAKILNIYMNEDDRTLNWFYIELVGGEKEPAVFLDRGLTTRYIICSARDDTRALFLCEVSMPRLPGFSALF